MTRALQWLGRFRISTDAVQLFRKHYADHLMDHSRFYPNCRETVEFFSRQKAGYLLQQTRGLCKKNSCKPRTAWLPFPPSSAGTVSKPANPIPEGLLPACWTRHRFVALTKPIMVGDSAGGYRNRKERQRQNLRSDLRHGRYQRDPGS